MSNNEKTASKTKHTREHGATPKTLHVRQRIDADGLSHTLCGKAWRQTTAEKFDDITHNYAGFIKCTACYTLLYMECYEIAQRRHPDYPPERLDRIAQAAYDMKTRTT